MGPRFWNEPTKDSAKSPLICCTPAPPSKSQHHRAKNCAAKANFSNYTPHLGDSGVEDLPSEEAVGGIYLYIFAKNESGDVMALRSCPMTKKRNGDFEVRSKIMVKDRGKGYAKPTDEAFCQIMQWIANRSKQKVTWLVRNQNLEKLVMLEEAQNPDPEKLERARTEQQRWQKLYGQGGHFKIQDRKRTFEPQQDIEGITAQTREQL